MYKLHSKQRELIAKILVDLGKMFFAASVVGFFIPATAAKINLFSFLGGLITSIVLFIGGITIIKPQNTNNYEY